MKELFITLFGLITLSCTNIETETVAIQTDPVEKKDVENVIIIVIDGPRYDHCFGDSTFSNIPKIGKELLPLGTFYPFVYNNGITKTVPGHVAITTGFYQEINNYGSPTPDSPSFFQYYLKKTGYDSTKTWIIASKDKLESLSNCKDTIWANQYRPAVDCGINGLESGYRDDSTTYTHALSVLEKYTPNLVLINFKEPDYSGHEADSLGYIRGLKKSDEYVYGLWNYIQSSENYKDNTVILITNDHGRHLNGIADGWTNHGDKCEGCKHVGILAIGGPFKQGQVVSKKTDLTQITTTISALFKLGMNHPNKKSLVDKKR